MVTLFIVCGGYILITYLILFGFTSKKSNFPKENENTEVMNDFVVFSALDLTNDQLNNVSKQVDDSSQKVEVLPVTTPNVETEHVETESKKKQIIETSEFDSVEETIDMDSASELDKLDELKKDNDEAFEMDEIENVEIPSEVKTNEVKSEKQINSISLDDLNNSFN